MRLFRVLIAVTVLSGTAYGDDSVFSNRKSEATALNTAMGATFAPAIVGALLLHLGSDRSRFDESAAAAIIATGAILGPGLGHLYADNKGKFLTSTLMRVLCAGAMVLGESQSDDPIRSQSSGSVSSSQGDSGSGYALFFFGAVGYGTITIYDFVTTGNSVDSYNERALSQGVRLEPVMRVDSRYAGLRLSLNF